MRITFGLLIILLVAHTASGQSKSDKMYDTFRGKEGVSHFTFSKNMLDAIDLDLGDDDEKNVTGDLFEVRFMSYNPEKGSMNGPEFTKKAVSLLPSAYKKFKDKDHDDSDAEIWLLGKKKTYKECHVFIKNEDSDQMRFVVSFYGDFNVNDVEELKAVGQGFSEE